MMYRCYNCDEVYDESQVTFEISRYHERVSEDDEVIPDGECKVCGALVYAEDKRAQA